MTVAQFKYLLTNNQTLDSVTRQVNLLYTGSRIQAIAIRIENGNIEQLQEATTLVLKAPEAGSTLNISLENSQVPFRTVDREIIGEYFLYDIIQEDQQPVMSVPPSPSGSPLLENYYTDIILLPQQDREGFNVGEYNILLNNLLTSRTSDYLQVSDRLYALGSGTNPQNLPDILQDNAILASVQDSLYSDTGWVNARYEGTQTSELTYGGVQPALTGGTFEGTYYALSVEDEVIFNATERAFSEYFFTGRTEIPTYTELTTFIELNEDIGAGESPLLLIIGNPSSKLEVEAGSLIRISGSLGTAEIIRVTEVIPTSPLGYKRVIATVERGWNRTPTVGYSESDDILLIDPQVVYKIGGAKIFQEKQGKVYVKETQQILFLDDFGQIVSSSASP